MNLETKYSILSYKNNSDCMLSNFKILNLIYLPILKSDSFTLYSLFNSQLGFKNLDLSVIKNIYGFKLSDIKNSLQKLEGLNLLQTFYNNDDNEIIFNIVEPLNFNSFFANRKLKKLFIKKTSQKYFEKISKLFDSSKNLKIKNFKNITQNFKYNLFDECTNTLLFDNNISSEITETEEIVLQNDNLDIQNEEFDNNNNNIDKNKNNFNNDKNEINKSSENIQKIDHVNFQQKNLYEKSNLLIDVSKIDSNFNSIKYITYFGENFTKQSFEIFKKNKVESVKRPPDEYLKLLRGRSLNIDEQVWISNIISNTKLKFTVINCLLEFIFLTNNKIIQKTYFQKIADSFVNNNIDDVENAITYLQKAFIFRKHKEVRFINDNFKSPVEKFNLDEYDITYNPEIKNDFDFDSDVKNKLLSYYN